MIRRAAVVLVLLATLSSAQAAPIYRCGPDGKTYSQVPCPEGRVVESSDPRSAAQRKEAARVAAAERRRADELERERLARERAAAPAPRAAPPASGPRAAKARPKKEAPKDFVAVVPGQKPRGK